MRLTPDWSGDPESVAEQVLRQSLTTQLDDAVTRLVDTRPELGDLLAIQAEVKVILRQMKDVKLVVQRHSRPQERTRT